MRLFILVRHGQSELNVVRRVNGDPTVKVELTPQGEAEAEGLRLQVAHVSLDLCVHTRFERSLRTAEIAIATRAVPLLEEPLLDDIDIGDLEGETIEDYRAWKAEHTRADAFPGGESLDAAARRYADAFRKLADQGSPDVVLIVTHEIPIRYALNAVAGSTDLDGPMHEIRNATPYVFDDASLRRAGERIEQLAG